MSGIRIVRERSAWADRARAYKVIVDDEHVGEIGNGEEAVFDIAPGRHRVQLRIDWARSQPVEVDVAEGAEARLACRARNPLLALYWITLGRNRYVVLEHTDGAGH